MNFLYRLLLSLLAVVVLFMLSSCGGSYNCQVTFGDGTCNNTGGGGLGGGGTGGGGGGGGGTGGVDASQAAALIYYAVPTINAAGVTSSGAFGTLNNYTGPTLGSNIADSMLIVRRQFLYVPMGDNTVVGYSIDRQTGALTLIAGSPVTVAGTSVTADDVATDPLGQYLFVGSETGAQVWVFTINSSTGALTTVAGSPFTSGFSAGAASDNMAVDASGRFLYVGQLGSTGIAGFSIGTGASGGVLTPLAGSPFTGTNFPVQQIHASPTAGLLLAVQAVADSTTKAIDKHLYVYSIDSTTGALAPVTGSPFLTGTGNAPFDFAISPNGNLVYALEANVTTTSDAPIEGFSLNSGTGQLTSLGAFDGVPTSERCQFDQTGIYLFCIDSLTTQSKITVNGVNLSTGALTHGADLAVTGDFPFAVTD